MALISNTIISFRKLKDCFIINKKENNFNNVPRIDLKIFFLNLTL